MPDTPTAARTLRPVALRIYTHLTTVADWISTVQTAEDLHLSDSYTVRILGELHDAGLVEKKRGPRIGPGRIPLMWKTV